MVHNGIEYGDMQMICEAYDLMQNVLGMSPAEMGDIFTRWNEGELDSFLIEITADILKQADPITGKPFVDIVLDTAGQKGTGKWTSVNALDMGTPAPTVAEAVFARCLSAVKHERVAAENYDRRKEVDFQEGRNADVSVQIRDSEIRLKEKEDSLFACRRDVESLRITSTQNRTDNGDLTAEREALEKHAQCLQGQNADLAGELERFVQTDEVLRG